MIKEGNLKAAGMPVSKDVEMMQKIIQVFGDIASLIINSNHSADYGIDESLARIGNLISASRVYVLLDEKEGRYLRNTHEWVNQVIGHSMFSWPLYDYEYDLPSLKKLLTERDVLYGHTREMPKDLFQVLSKQKVCTIYMAPLMRDGARIGVVGFDFCDSEVEWRDDYAMVLRYLTAFVGIALERKQFHLLQSKLHKIHSTLADLSPIIFEGEGEVTSEIYPSKPVTLLDSERRIIIETLEQYNGNKLKTAKHLGLTWPSLDRRCKKLGIEVKRK